MLSILYITIGLLGLIFGGDWLVDGAVGIAQRARLSPMVIGLTIVAFGTSAPELLVSLQAAFTGNPGIALGNVVGSNIANIALILGLTALIRPIPVHHSTTKIDAPFLFLSSVALAAICRFTDTITRLEGIIALLALFAFVGYQIYTSKQAAASAQPTATPETASTQPAGETASTQPTAETETAQPSAETENASAPIPLWRALIFLLLGIAALKYGAEYLVKGAVDIAKGLGVADRVIGLTIVAIGTSLPELFASIIAARKGNVDLAVGNVVGSNLFNILCVLGASCAIQPIDLNLVGGPAFATDCLWMLALTALIWLQLRTDYRLSRSEGAVLLTLYTIFIALTFV